METHPLGIAAKQVVRWLMDEDRAGQHRLQISASCQYLPEEIPTLEQSRLGDVEGEGISKIAAVGILEVTPLHTAVRVRIEDTLGRRMPDDASASSQPEDIDLTTFQEAFVVPRRGTAFVAVETENYRAWSSFQKLLDEMRANKHVL